MSNKNSQPAPDLAAARSRINAWRKSQGGRRRIPAEFWTLASDLARSHGVYRVGQAMRLNSGRLRECMESRATIKSPRPNEPPAFVEVLPPPHKPAECTVEVVSENGARVSIRTSSLANIAALFTAPSVAASTSRQS